MNLVMERNLQHFMQLSALPETAVTCEMQWQQEAYLLHLAVKNDRLTLTSGRNDITQTNAVLVLQRRWRIERFLGVPQRIFRLSRPLTATPYSTPISRQACLIISCTAPQNSDAEFWFQLYIQQRVLLQSLGSGGV